MKTNQAIGILSHHIGLFSFLITNNDSLDFNIRISLLREGKSLKIASKQGFLAPGLEKWTKVVQARILVKSGRSISVPPPPRAISRLDFGQFQSAEIVLWKIDIFFA